MAVRIISHSTFGTGVKPCSHIKENIHIFLVFEAIFVSVVSLFEIVGASDVAAGFHYSLVDARLPRTEQLLFTLQLHGITDCVALLWLRSLLLCVRMMDIFLVQL